MGHFVKNKEGSDNIVAHLLPSAVAPHFLTAQALNSIISALEACYVPSFTSAMLVLGVHALYMHYEFLLHKVGSVSLGVLYGDVQTGKKYCNAVCSCTTWNTGISLEKEMFRWSLF